MNVVCRCTACGAQFKVDEKYAGKKAKCPKCATVVVVPSGLDPPTKPEPPAKPAPPRADSPPIINISVGASAPSILAAKPAVAVNVVAQTKGEPTKPAKKKPLLQIVPIAVGGVLALILVGAFFGIISFMRGSGKAKITSDRPLLVVELSLDERKETSVSIDGKKQTIPRSGNVEYSLKPGSHQLMIQRRGYEPVEVTLSLKAGDRHPFRPEWKANAVAALPGSHVPGSSGGSTLNNAASSGVSGFGGWLQNLEVAKRNAERGKKDLLMIFVGSDWSEESKALQDEVFFLPEFRQLADVKFIPVVIDLPQGAAAYNMIEDRAQNARLRQQFHITPDDLPALVLADAEGRPYALHKTYEPGSGATYFEALKKSLDDRQERDKMLALPNSASGPERLGAATEAAAWLQKRRLAGHYQPEVQAWLKFAEEYDPQNEHGRHEILFEADWLCRLNAMFENFSPDRLKRHVAELTNWQQTRKIRENNRGARLHLVAAMLLARIEDKAGAAREIERGLAFNPNDAALRETLQGGATALEQAGQLSSGSGFVVGAEGYILTNHHVIEGPGKLMVRFSADRKDVLPASVVAKDAIRDLALIKVNMPGEGKLTPAVVSSAEVRRGARIAAFGFPLGDRIGTGLKLTQGVVGALADPKNDNMMLLDMRVNPGNSGGPLCNARGHVIGIVTQKTRRALDEEGNDREDSYGLARPSPDLHDFLQKNLPGYAPPADDGSKESLEWDEVDRRMSPSVVMVLKMER